MKWVVIAFSLLVGCGILFVVYFIFSFIFVGTVSEIKIALSEESKSLEDGVQIEDVSVKDASPYVQEDEPINQFSSQQMLTPENELVAQISRNESSPNRFVNVLPLVEKDSFLIFLDGKMHFLKNDQLTEAIFSFKDGGYQVITAFHFSTNLKLIITRKDFKYHLFGFDRTKQEVKLMVEDVGFSPVGYYPSLRAFSNGKTDEKVLIYYSGEDYLYGYGGDSSRPKKSYVRFFDKKTPFGRNLAEFSYKAGMIVDVNFEETDLILTGDTNRPNQVKDNLRPQKKWKLGFQR